MKTLRTVSFRWQIICTILLIIVSVLSAVVFELKLRLVDADQTSVRMCNELGRLVAHTRFPKERILTVPICDFIERGAYRRNGDIPILDKLRVPVPFTMIFEEALKSERARLSGQNRQSGEGFQ